MQPKKALFVDDDKFLLDMYALKFSKAGYDVKTGDSMESGLKVLRDGFVPDIMMVDIVMPGPDGLEFMSAVRKEKLAPNAKVVMLTNQGNPDDISRAKKLNVDGYIVKATSIPSEVLAEVEKILAAKKA
ncbi:MAG: two component transcriptional regulator, two-component system, OmpR family, response regulator [Candidatus Parcubacteria bacterium]|nr:two component transcriptional regulator, two-component system, OmpR family, response regulator [Candidatus Parcubacteria bacterium]